MTVFVLSIETTLGNSHQHGFHLGTDEREARQIVEEKFAAYITHHIPVVTMALKLNGKLFDVYYGDKWHSEVSSNG